MKSMRTVTVFDRQTNKGTKYALKDSAVTVDKEE